MKAAGFGSPLFCCSLINAVAQHRRLGVLPLLPYLLSGHFLQFFMAENNREHGRQDCERRINVEGVRRILGMIGRNYNDAEISDILNCLYGFAEEAYDRFEHPQGEADDDAPV